MPRIHGLYPKLEVTRINFRTAKRERIVYSVCIDFDELEELATKARNNKSRQSRMGPLRIECIRSEEVQ